MMTVPEYHCPLPVQNYICSVGQWNGLDLNLQSLDDHTMQQGNVLQYVTQIQAQMWLNKIQKYPVLLLFIDSDEMLAMY